LIRPLDGDHVIDPVRIGPDSWQGKERSRVIETSKPILCEEFARG